MLLMNEWMSICVAVPHIFPPRLMKYVVLDYKAHLTSPDWNDWSAKRAYVSICEKFTLWRVREWSNFWGWLTPKEITKRIEERTKFITCRMSLLPSTHRRLNTFLYTVFDKVWICEITELWESKQNYTLSISRLNIWGCV